MYIIQNALANLLRNKGRNILIAAIIFAIVTTTVVALIINNTAAAEIERYKETLSAQVHFTPNQEKMMEQAQQQQEQAGDGPQFFRMRMPEMSPESMLAFTASDALSGYDISGSINANSDRFRAIDHNDDADLNAGPTVSSSAGGGTSVGRMMGGGGNFRLYGGYWADFDQKNGSRALRDDGVSAFPENDDECIISGDLAAENGVGVGDTITFQAQMTFELSDDDDMSGYASGDKWVRNGVEYTLASDFGDFFRATRDITLTLTVTGIYDDL